MFPNWAKTILFLLVFMLSGLTLVIIIEGLLSGTDLTPLNTAIEGLISYFRTPFLTNLMIGVTHIGSPFVLFVSSCLISTLLALHKERYNAILFIVAMVVAVVSLVVLKETFQVSRPATDLIDAAGWSFPSGHATVSTAFFFLVGHAFFRWPRKVSGKVALVIGSIVGAGLVSFSRLYLGAHWTLDIIAGIALGILSTSFVILVFSVFLRERSWDRRRL
ncbi:MAG: phosphatase PAP2 family protein [bacterium]|nr:phosphatase PAP2 family protein [bacterium]